MKIHLTDDARSFLAEQKATAVTVASLLFSSCCSGPLPPEVKPGAPADTEGFVPYPAEGLTVWFDSLLDPREEIVIDLKEFPMYRELFIQGWE
ncbi:MAG: CC/Se motif family (seleno)protein [Bacillota bacterium]